ncbi:unnamed protein product [Echinostoma caproni]|uniref:Carboxylic ester hydrolase n=1 Tax=Echinostoma caproni TaxID=27848 RepID=A0A183AB01_9TREM|nr:unnamed protein product [Echinostoma caproni]
MHNTSCFSCFFISGIRYAQPPVGRLRFRKPVPPIPEPKTMFSSVELPPTCPQPKDTMFQDSAAARMWQPNTPMSEDCLFLNIFVPSPPESERTDMEREKLAVMVRVEYVFTVCLLRWQALMKTFIFYMGTPTLSVYDGRFLAARQNIIVASMNYRIGPLGFIYMNNEEAPGNMGLWDQRLAMKWIKDHIADFGGDPERITLFGESAGAVSVSTHVVSPWSHGYFTNAIMQSGSIFGNWGLSSGVDQLNRTHKFANILGCHKGSEMDIINCLRSKSVNDILDAHNTMFDPDSYFYVPFPPVLDNHFLPYSAPSTFRQLHHLKPDGALMFGINKNEGSYFLLYAFVQNQHWRREQTQLPIYNRSDYLRCLRRVLDLDDDDGPEYTEPLVRYTDFEYETYEYLPSLATWTERLETISSDRSFKCPTIDMATTVMNEYRYSGRRVAHTLPVYFYEFQHRTASVPWPKWTGTMHGYEIEYVFGIPFSPQFQATFYRFTDEERRLSDMMMTYWANFARTGDPNILPERKHVSDLNHVGMGPLMGEKDSELKNVADYLNRNGLPTSLSKSDFLAWPLFLNRTAYMIFKAAPDELFVGTSPRERQCLFWRNWYPALLQQGWFICRFFTCCMSW